MYKLFILSIAVFISCNAYSQNYSNNWIFGDSAGLNFSTIIPTSISSKILSHEACASISDSMGNLLFYTNGQKVWDSNNEVMPNGDSLNIGKLSFDDPSSITQGVTILPKPGSNTMYYIFQLQAENGPPDNYGLEYTTIDITLNAGLGDVVSKNIDVYTGYLDEKMQIVKHGNGKDYWLLTKQTALDDTSLCFALFHINEDTIEGPFVQCFTGLNDAGSSGVGSTGQMKFSQDGTKLVFTRGVYFILIDFDRCSGDLSNLKEILYADKGLYGCAFSKDARMVYFSETASFFEENKIIQYCLSCPEPIEDTKQIIYEDTDLNHAIGQLQLGPDDKIYATIFNNVYNDHLNTSINTTISVINNPEIIGLGCNFDTLTIPLISGRCTISLPNMPNYNLGPLLGSECDTLQIAVNDILPNEEFLIFPNPARDNIYFKFSDNNLSLANINSIAITDVTGHIVKNIYLLQNNVIYVGDLISGIYFVNITWFNKQSTIEKLFIEN